MTEDQLEQETLGWLQDVGYTCRSGRDIAPDGNDPQRSNYRDVILLERLRDAVQRLNPNIPATAREAAVQQVKDLGRPMPLSANRAFHKQLVYGVPVEYQQDGEMWGDQVVLMDWSDRKNNELPTQRW